MEAQTFFLGVIALCMVIITVGMVGIGVVLLAILRVLVKLLYKVNVDYEAISPKVHRIVENLEYGTSFIGFVNLFRRKRK